MSRMDGLIKTEKDREVAEHLTRSPITMQKFVKLYGSLCRKCKLRVTTRVKRGGKASLKDLCDACQLKAEAILK